MRNEKLEQDRLASALLAARDRSDNWRRASWLLSDFDAPVWALKLESDSRIDFRVALEDETSLMSLTNRPLVETMKRFIVAQTNLEFTGGVVYADSSLGNRILAAVHICEYLLMRCEELRLAEFGLAAMSESAAYQLLRDIAQRGCSESVYQWHTRLSKFLKMESAKLSGEDMRQICEERPEIICVTGCDVLDMNAAEVERARAWLWRSGFYRLASAERGGSCVILDSSKIVPILYPRGTLKDSWKKSRIRELELSHGPKLGKEFGRIPVRAEKRSDAPLRFYIRALSAFELLEKQNQYVPSCLLRAARDTSFHSQLPLSQVKRFRTVPHEIVLKAIRHSLEFALEFGELLLDAYAKLVEICLAERKTLVNAGRSPERFADQKLLAMGLNCWSISTELRKNRRHGLAECSVEIQRAFFPAMRENQGLYELMQVLWGAILVGLGALSARRQGELINLPAESFLDQSGTRLVFLGRKRNALNFREVMRRPIPTVVTNMLQRLKSLQTRLIELGAMRGYGALFAFPGLQTTALKAASDENCNDALDRFCDYFEMPLDEGGHRYYLRHHQLRRFFAQLFLHGNSSGALETLRWFLGHTDPQHLWRYITEDTPGEVLLQCKVDYILERLATMASDADEVAQALKARFGAGALTLLDSAEIGDWIESQIQGATLRVEPVFFRGHTGQEYTILILVDGESQ